MALYASHTCPDPACHTFETSVDLTSASHGDRGSRSSGIMLCGWSTSSCTLSVCSGLSATKPEARLARHCRLGKSDESTKLRVLIAPGCAFARNLPADTDANADAIDSDRQLSP